ncbi:DeoR/GlpR family DNA-binding transcription regulator [Paramicrobacterium agarici]|uniref:DeoR/GlpR family DNA-binding transcription regulator n=1 Tax=Paramicrobacterium agarici TaxID=630514 RepID=UPI00114E53E5|nr:DeoR/GlpR family DNA-binding transcription regulator [Microbacterium agarici]TQO22934.1 DeoR family transcriptional regulator [Microbacterium agarici]
MAPDAPDRLSRQARQNRIIDHLTREGSASAAELVELTGRSLMTIHRDIDELAAKGFIRKFHGGVSALPTSVFESSAEFRRTRNPAAKSALAKTASELIEPGMSVMVDDSTTCLALAPFLAEIGPLTVLTNFRQLGEELRLSESIHLIMIGGTYSRSHDSYIGPPDITGLGSYSVDIVFQSTSTMNASWTFHQEQDVVSMKRVMLSAGARRILMMDSSKVGKSSLHRYVEVSEFTDLVVTDDVEKGFIDDVDESVTVHLARV